MKRLLYGAIVIPSLFIEWGILLHKLLHHKYIECEMQEGFPVRLCFVCEKTIEKGEKYLAVVVPEVASNFLSWIKRSHTHSGYVEMIHTKCWERSKNEHNRDID